MAILGILLMVIIDWLNHEYGNHPEPHGHRGCALCHTEGRIDPF